ncbi:MAG: NTP transferase domain-containing protein [Bacteroidales bacterium]|nr:NTP transferase domain-containing protein [Bacteroidales bacterium]
MDVNNKITGIVLAGGKSSRMGTDKSLMLFKGKTLIEQAIDVFTAIMRKR